MVILNCMVVCSKDTGEECVFNKQGINELRVTASI